MSENCYSSCQWTGEALYCCAMAHVVQSPSAVWEIETEWNPSLLPWLFVVICLPYSSPHKQMVASLACPVYTDENMCVTWVSVGVYVTAHKIVRGNNMVEFIPIHHEKLLEKCPPYLPQQRVYCLFLCLLQIRERVIGLDWMYLFERMEYSSLTMLQNEKASAQWGKSANHTACQYDLQMYTQISC